MPVPYRCATTSALRLYSYLFVQVALVNDLAVLISAGTVRVLVLQADVYSALEIFGQLFQVVAGRVSRDALVLGGAGLGRVLAALLVAVVTAVCAANPSSRAPDESAADVARGRGRVVELLEAVGGGEGDLGTRHRVAYNLSQVLFITCHRKLNS